MKCDCGGSIVNLPHYGWCSSLKKGFIVEESTPTEGSIYDEVQRQFESGLVSAEDFGVYFKLKWTAEPALVPASEPGLLDLERFYAASDKNQTAHFGYDYDNDTFACWCGKRLDADYAPGEAWLVDFKIAEFCTLHAGCKRAS